MELESMKFRASWLDAIKNLPKDRWADIMMAIIECGLGRETTVKLDPITKALLCMAAPELESERQTQINIIERNRANGKRGGRPRKQTEDESVMCDDMEASTNENTKTQENPRKPKETQKNPKETQKNQDKKEKEKEKESSPLASPYKEKEKEKEKEPSNPLKGEVEKTFSTTPSSLFESDDMRQNEEPNRERIDYEALRRFYNEKCGNSLGLCTKMTEARKKAVKCRCSEHGKMAIMQVITKASVSSFLCGGNEKNWRANFDWLFKPTNFVKILEGNYDRETRQQSKQNDWRRGMEVVATTADDFGDL